MGLFSPSRLNSTRRRMLRNREFVRNYKEDKSCEICGYNKFPELLVFHHKNKKEKNKGINILMKSLKNLKIIENEINNCRLLCSNCHRELHLKERQKQRK